MPFSFFNISRVLISALVLVSWSGMPAHAQESAVVDIVPADEVDESTRIEKIADTHAPLKITPDKSEIVTLDKDAATVIIGNSAHLNILADSGKRLIFVPRLPGATYVNVLDAEGNVLMQRHVIVASPKKKYLRVRRSCAGNQNCQPTQVYYCPDICHEVSIASGEASGEKSGSMEEELEDTIEQNLNEIAEDVLEGAN